MVEVSPSIQERVIATYGTFFEGLSGIPAGKCGRDVLDEEKVHDQVELLCRTIGREREWLAGKRMLEVGCGFGIFVAVTRRDYGMESVGVEPATVGFDTSFEIGREIQAEYGTTADCIVNATGEALPFPDNHFDVVFSSTVLEHTADPRAVLHEAIRTLKPAGYLQFVYPNYGAFFEGHYAIPWIPYLGLRLGSLWVRLWGRDPAFLGTLQFTNYFATRRWLRGRDDIRVVTYGEEIFRDRMLNLRIKEWAGLGRIKAWLDVAHRFRMVGLLTRVCLLVKSFDPIVLTLQKTPVPGEQD